MLDCLPHGVVVDILSRLPVKLLVRFRCVSKAWCSLISSPHFISTHLNRSLSNSQHQPCLYVTHNFTFHTLLLYPSNPEIEQKGAFFANPSDGIQLDDPSKDEFELLLVGSSNGLLCLANTTFNNESGLCVLWNPSIQKAISLPKPNIGFDHSLHQSVGFGYDPTTDDYKFVRLVYLRDTEFSSFLTVPPLVEIYTLRTGIWRSVTAPGPPYVIRDWSPSVFVNGAIHWIAHTPHHPRKQGAYCNVVVSFNMKDETFGEVGMPKSLQGLHRLDVAVAQVDGLLALVPCDYYRSVAYNSVWVMKEYGVTESWTKLFDVCFWPFSRVIGVTKTGEVLVHKADRLFSSGPSSRGYLENPPIRGLEEIYLDTYVESLVLLNVADRVLGRQGNSSGGSNLRKKSR
jgi:F-box interacting protein